MSKQKITSCSAAKPPVAPAGHGSELEARAKAPEPEVVSFEIVDDDFGGDPYNHTGSHCILNFTDDQ